MNSWWHPSSWWSPNAVTNPKSYVLHMYFSPNGRIGVGTWFWFWLYLTIIWCYFLHPVFALSRYDFMVACTGVDYYWDAPDAIYYPCDEAYYAKMNSGLTSFLFVWLLLLYPFFALSVKRFHDIGYDGTHLTLCFFGAFLWGLGALFYFYYAFRESSHGYGPDSTEAKKHGKTIATFGKIWDYESKEIQTAAKWEKQGGYKEAIEIHLRLGRMGDIKRLEKSHIVDMWNKFISKKANMESQGVICKRLISAQNFAAIIENSKYKDELSDIVANEHYARVK